LDDGTIIAFMTSMIFPFDTVLAGIACPGAAGPNAVGGGASHGGSCGPPMDEGLSCPSCPARATLPTNTARVIAKHQFTTRIVWPPENIRMIALSD
jgi:hypothetical protein